MHFSCVYNTIYFKDNRGELTNEKNIIDNNATCWSIFNP